MMMTMMSPPTSSARRSTASVQSWFQAKLDVLGIESVYSRYIISLLLQHDNYHCSADGDLASSPECTHVIGGFSEGTACSHHHQHHHHHHRQCATANNNNNNAGEQSRNTAAVENKNAAGQGNKWGSGGGDGIGGAGSGRRQRSASRRDRQQPLSAEQRKKREAVGCLLEICDDILTGDIENLIEELMLRLKQVDNERSSTTQPVISPPSANNHHPASSGTNSRQDPAEQYYAAFPALSGDTKMTSQTQSSQVSIISSTDVSNVWKKKQQQQQQQLQQQQQQQQSQKMAATLSAQTGNSINLEGAPTRGRQNNAASRRRRGCLSHHGNKENLHKPPFTLRGKDDRGSRYGSHGNRLRGGRGRSSRSLVSDTRQKLSQSSSHQPCSRNIGTRRCGGGGGNAPANSDGDYCLSVENILKDILRTANKNSSRAEKVGHEQEASYPYNFAGRLWVPKIESGLRDLQPRNKKMSLNLTGKAFEENSAWYDISFLDNRHTSSDKDISLTSPPSLSMSVIGPKSKQRSYVRLYKRHSYPPPSPRSVLTLEGLEEKEILKKFSCLGPRVDKVPNPKTALVVNPTKKSSASKGTDNIMYAATENVVDSSVRSLLDCSPEEILPSLSRSPSDELERSLHLLSGYPPLTDLQGCSPSFLNGSISSSGTFCPTAADVSPCGWSPSPVKALSPSGVASPTTPVSSPNSTTSLSLLDVSYLTNMAGREKRSLDKTQKADSKTKASSLCLEHLFPDEFSNHIPDLSSLLESPHRLVAGIKSRNNFTYDPYVFVSNTQSSFAEDDDEGFDLAVTPTPLHGAVGQAIYNTTTYRPWSYALVEERIMSEVQTSDILARNECFSQVWDVNFQRRVIPTSQTCSNRTNFTYSQHPPKLDASPSFLLHSTCYELSTPRVTPFTFFFSSLLNTSPPPIDNCESHQKSVLGKSEKALPAILSSTNSASVCEKASVDSIKINKQDTMLSTACSKTYHLDDSCSASPSSSPNVKLALTMTTTVLSSSRSAISSTSSGTSSSSSSPLLQEPLPGEPIHSNRLVPSVNSAFESVVPSKKKSSDTDSVTQRITPEDEVMRQVNPSASPRETLYFSPKTHFQPIRSPLLLADTLELSLSESVTTGMNTVVKASDLTVQPTEFVTPPCLYHPPDLFGGHTASRSPYQQFKPETHWEDGEEKKVSFVPSFKILKDHNKFVQTGSAEENLDIDLEKLADDVCTENAKPRPVSFLKTAALRSTDPGRLTDRFAGAWKQPTTLADLSAWSQEEPGKDTKVPYLNTWNLERASGWTPVTSGDKWPSAFSSPSSICSLEHRPYVFARDSVWYTTAGTLSAVRDDAWLSSSSGTPNSGLSTPCTTSADPQTRINVVCKSKDKKEILQSEACVSPSLVSEEESSSVNRNIWSSGSVDWTVNSMTPVYLQVHHHMWDTDEGCGKTVVEEEACKFPSPEIKPKLLTPETLKRTSSSQSAWPSKIWEPESYDSHQDEALSKGAKSALSADDTFVQMETTLSDRENEISTEEEPAPKSQDGSYSLRFDSTNIWAVPNATMWSLPILTHSSSSSTSASLAASPSSAPSPPLSSLTHPPTSSDPLLDLVCGPTCTQTVGASKTCQHQQIRKIWEHIGPTTNSTGHGDSGDKKEATKNPPHQVHGAKENRPPFINNIQTRSQELPSFSSVRQLTSVSVTPPGASHQGTNHQKPPSLSLGPPPLVPLPSAAVYSSELEKQWLSGETSCSSSAASVQRIKMQYEKSRSCKKPCSFYLEGNCWRQECKYAHDICTITCRFWEDGECFKGDTCPFLHGYSGESVRPSMDSCSSNSSSSSSSFTRKTEASPSIAATIHTASIAHPSAPPEEFEKECRSLTQSKALSDRISIVNADPQNGSIPAFSATDVLGQGSAVETSAATSCSGSDTLPNTAAGPGCNRRGSESQVATSTALSSSSPSSSPPPSAS